MSNEEYDAQQQQKIPSQESDIQPEQQVESESNDLIATACQVIPAILSQKLVVMPKESIIQVFAFLQQMIPLADEFAERNQRDDLDQLVNFLGTGAGPFVEQMVSDFLADVSHDPQRWADIDIVAFSADAEHGVRVQGAPGQALSEIAEQLGPEFLDWWDSIPKSFPGVPSVVFAQRQQ